MSFLVTLCVGEGPSSWNSSRSAHIFSLEWSRLDGCKRFSQELVCTSAVPCCMAPARGTYGQLAARIEASCGINTNTAG